MTIAGIICEYNPLHEGHVYHMNETRRRTGCDYIVCVMAGAFMQRGESSPRIITVRDLKLNMNNRSVTVGDRDVNLTAKEFDLLQLFVTNRGKVFSRENLLETIWKYDYLGDLRTVDVHIRRLREKIEKTPSQPEYIFTKWGVGYYFTDKD